MTFQYPENSRFSTPFPVEELLAKLQELKDALNTGKDSL